MSDARVIRASGVQNFRDFGDWEAENGAQIVRGRLYRSGHWANAEKAAHHHLERTGIEVFIDLRRPFERTKQPNVLPDDLGIKTVSSQGADMEDPPHVKFLRGGNLTESSVRLYMHGAYRRIPTEEHHQQLFRQTILELIKGRTVLIHCAAGKDRTGILAALILGLMGVPKEIILQDYLLTNTAVDIASLLPDIAKRVSKQIGQSVEPEVLFPMLGVEPGFLLEAQKVIGSPRKYALEQLGLSLRDLERLKTSLAV